MPLYFTGGGVVLAPIAGQNIITASADNVSPLTLLRHSNTQSADILTWLQSDGTTVLGRIDSTGSIFAPDGSASLPGIRFQAAATGMFRSGGTLGFTSGGALTIQIQATGNLLTNGLNIASANSLSWSNDLFLYRDAANTLALRNGANAQIANIYETFTDLSNYRRAGLFAKAYGLTGAVALTAQGAGTGGDVNLFIGSDTTNGILYFRAGNSTRWQILNTGHLYAIAANAYDIGQAVDASNMNAPRSIYARTSVIAPVFTSNLGASTGTMNGVGQANVQTSAAGVGNGADTTDDTLFTYSLPINAMSANGKALLVRATGQFAANANPKEVKLWFGGTMISDSGILTLSGKTWTVTGEIIRVDATHVSVIGQFAGDTASVQDVTVTPNLVVADLTANATVLKVTGASTTIGAASDVLGYSLRAEFAN